MDNFKALRTFVKHGKNAAFGLAIVLLIAILYCVYLGTLTLVPAVLAALGACVAVFLFMVLVDMTRLVSEMLLPQ